MAEAFVTDTLRFAGRQGGEDQASHAAAISRTFNRALIAGVVTQAKLGSTMTLRGENLATGAKHDVALETVHGERHDS